MAIVDINQNQGNAYIVEGDSFDDTKYFVVGKVNGDINKLLVSLCKRGFDIDNPKHILISLGEFISFNGDVADKSVLDFISKIGKDRFIGILSPRDKEEAFRSVYIDYPNKRYSGYYKTYCTTKSLIMGNLVFINPFIVSINGIRGQIMRGELPNNPVFISGNLTPFDVWSMGQRKYNLEDNPYYLTPCMHKAVSDGYSVIGVGSDNLGEIPCLTFSGRTTVHTQVAKMCEDYHEDWKDMFFKIKEML